MFSVIPHKFLPNSKSPCWYEEFTGRNTTDPYLTNSYVLYSKRFRATFDALRKAFWGHLSHAHGKHFRLRCLPRFYIIGQPKCGTTDLYDRLRLHPEVKFSAIKEPHWWTRKRFGACQSGPRSLRRGCTWGSLTKPGASAAFIQSLLTRTSGSGSGVTVRFGVTVRVGVGALRLTRAGLCEAAGGMQGREMRKHAEMRRSDNSLV